MLRALLLTAMLGPRWVAVHDGLAHHQRWMNRTGNVLGEYYAMQPGDFRAQCYAGAPVSVATEEAARAFVLRCEVW